MLWREAVGVQHVRLQHGIKRNALQMNAMISQYIPIKFQMLTDFQTGRSSSSGFKMANVCSMILLLWGAQIIMR